MRDRLEDKVAGLIIRSLERGTLGSFPTPATNSVVTVKDTSKSIERTVSVVRIHPSPQNQYVTIWGGNSAGRVRNKKKRFC